MQPSKSGNRLSPIFILITFLLVVVLPIVHAFAASISKQTIQTPPKPFLVYYDSENHLHRDIKFHVDVPARITSCVSALEKFRRDHPDVELELIDVAPSSESEQKAESESETSSESSSEIEKRSEKRNEKRREPFSIKELTHARNILLQTHSEELVTQLEQKCKKSKEQRILLGKSSLGHIGYVDGGDTYVTTETFDVCLRATAAWIRAAEYSIGKYGSYVHIIII